jgi:hypothetical protein
MTKQSKTKWALMACELLVDAYKQGAKRGGGIDWNDVDEAYNAALKAVGK